MKRSCLSIAAVALVLLAAYIVIGIRVAGVDPAGAMLMGLFCTVGGMLLLTALSGLWHTIRCHLALRRAEQGLPLRDGRFEAVRGPIATRAPALTSPIQRQACVIYKYEVRSRQHSHGRRQRFIHYGGVGQAPAIVTSERGEIRLAGFPSLDAVDEQWLDLNALSDETRHFFKETRFTQIPQSLAGFEKLKELLEGDQPALERNWSMQREPIGHHQTFAERCVLVGAPVCVFGIYSQERGALGHSWKQTPLDSTVLQLVPGSPADARRRLGRMLLTTSAVALVFFACSHMFLILSFINRP